ncbi:ABC transporter ATP-binding protein [uncultured Jannaschia sp.]|uniref:energy-coupling factor ABC transporter ATP-binding protein n=1 Tax=uncultured Jannaschia sp. TaxID=293347 RepID=UPI0026296E3E|nr:ABC transporter ATP-binding protein [uncultured Jannaschia sp.]
MDHPERRSRLELSSIGLVREGRRVLGVLDLDLDVGRLGVVGRNGSGKSTLTRLLAGLVCPTSGTVRLNGIDPAADRRAALAEVGILFQNPDHQLIFPTVLEEIAFGLGQQSLSRAEAEAEARRMLEKFGRVHWAGASVATLSHGQKHLVCLISVVAMAPRLLVLDEPFAGLDIPTKMQLSRHLRRFEGNVLHVSHDPADLGDCDRVLWLDEGRICMVGPAEQVLPEYIAAMNDLGRNHDLADLPG